MTEGRGGGVVGVGTHLTGVREAHDFGPVAHHHQLLVIGELVGAL